MLLQRGNASHQRMDDGLFDVSSKARALFEGSYQTAAKYGNVQFEGATCGQNMSPRARLESHLQPNVIRDLRPSGVCLSVPTE